MAGNFLTGYFLGRIPCAKAAKEANMMAMKSSFCNILIRCPISLFRGEKRHTQKEPMIQSVLDGTMTSIISNLNIDCVFFLFQFRLRVCVLSFTRLYVQPLRRLAVQMLRYFVMYCYRSIRRKAVLALMCLTVCCLCVLGFESFSRLKSFMYALKSFVFAFDKFFLAV